jgi:hypothetical protein
MRKRFISCFAGGVLGLLLASLIGDAFELPRIVAFVSCGLAGLALGYVGSTLIDVFSGSSEDASADSGQ